MLDVERIYLEPAVRDFPRGQEVLAAWPGAELIEISPRTREQLKLQRAKVSQTGGLNVRYQRGKKAKLVAAFRDLVAAHLPGCDVRYAF